MQQPAGAAMAGVAVEVEGDFAALDAVDRQAAAAGLALEVGDDRRHGRARRNLADAIAGQDVLHQAHQELAFRAHLPFHEAGANAVQHVLAQRPAVAAQGGQRPRGFHGGDGVRRRDHAGQVALPRQSADLDDHFRRQPAAVGVWPGPPNAIVIGGTRHPGGVAGQRVELVEAVAHQPRPCLVVGQGERRRPGGFRRNKIGQDDGVKAAGDDENGAVSIFRLVAGNFLTDCSGHTGFAGRGAVAPQRLRRVVEAGQGAVGGEAVDEGVPVPAVAVLEQVVPHFVEIAAAHPPGQGADVFAVQEVRVGGERIDAHGRQVVARLGETAGEDHFRIFQIDKAQPGAGGSAGAEGDEFRRVVAERVVGGEARRAKRRRLRPFAAGEPAALIDEAGVEGDGADAALVDEEVDERRERRGTFDEDGGGAARFDPAAQVGGAGRRVMADGEEGGAAVAQLRQQVGDELGGGEVGHRASPMEARMASGGRQPPDRGFGRCIFHQGADAP